MANIVDFLLGLDGYSRTGLFATLFFLVIYSIRQKYTVHYPDNLPRVRENGRTRFSLKTRLAYYTDCKALFNEAYETYSKKGKTCLIPGLGFRDEVLLPHSSLKWVASQPDGVLNVYNAFIEMDQAHYSAGSEQYILDPWQGQLVRKEMNTVLEKICAALNNELGVAVDERFSTGEEWREMDLLKSVMSIVAQASSRFTVGLPLCRDKEYLKASISYIDRFFIIAAIVGGMPKVLRPIIGPLVHTAQAPILRTMRGKFKQLHEERLAFCRATNKESPYEPQDHFQMMMRYGLSDRPQEVTNLTSMTGRIAVSNLGSYHQTTMALTNMLLDILDSDKEFNTIALLREEIASVVGSNGDWSKATIAKLVRCDSVCKETLRLHNFGGRSVMRKVMVPCTTEDGIVLPKGAMVSLLLTSQVDEEYFSSPHKFIPFRYLAMREKEEAGASFVSLGDKFLPFGYGRHACPGRFLLDFELKMTLSYLLMHYNIELAPEHKGVRPPSNWAAEARMPPPGAKIRVRRRKV